MFNLFNRVQQKFLTRSLRIRTKILHFEQTSADRKSESPDSSGRTDRQLNAFFRKFWTESGQNRDRQKPDRKTPDRKSGQNSVCRQTPDTLSRKIRSKLDKNRTRTVLYANVCVIMSRQSWDSHTSMIWTNDFQLRKSNHMLNFNRRKQLSFRCKRAHFILKCLFLNIPNEKMNQFNRIKLCQLVNRNIECQSNEVFAIELLKRKI